MRFNSLALQKIGLVHASFCLQLFPIDPKMYFHQMLSGKNIWTALICFIQVKIKIMYREFSPYANFISANCITTIFQKIP